MSEVLRILHLVGSAQEQFYCDLSRLYAQDCLKALAIPSLYEHHIAYITPDGGWRFPSSLEALEKVAPVSLVEAMAHIKQKEFHLALPQMFCLPGMTHYRSLLDLIGVPYLGNPGEIMALAADKAKTRAIVAAAGVKVPRGELLYRGMQPSLEPPVVIKPVNADNSLGVVYVKDREEYPQALTTAFTHFEPVLVEEYIPLGREVRCGILAREGKLQGLPLEEYYLDPQKKTIRTHADKLKRDERGELIYSAKDQTKSWLVAVEDPLHETVQEVAKKCHQALGCRHYSLFDFRIDPQGQPWFLEAGLYCSFSRQSVLVTMAKGAGIELEELFSLSISSAIGDRLSYA